jgi:hypothetical protein
MNEKLLELKGELARRDMRHRDLAGKLRELGHLVEADDIGRIVSRRWDPPKQIKGAIANILGRPSFELFT